MRILLDECVNPRVREAFPGHSVETVKGMGWGGITNGKLMALAKENFDVLVTVDKNLEHQQNFAKLTFGLVVVSVADNNIRFFRPIFTLLRQAVESIGPGQVIRVDGSDPETGGETDEE